MTLTVRPLSTNPLTSIPLSAIELGSTGQEYVYGLLPGQSLGTSQRVADAYGWHGGSFRRFSAGQPVIINGGSSETETVETYPARPMYPSWRESEGNAAGNGDVFWHQNPSGDTRLVQIQQIGTIATEYLTTHPESSGVEFTDSAGQTWRTGGPYNPWTGMWLEPSIIQSILNPTGLPDGGSNLIPDGTTPSLIQGQPDVQIFRGDTGSETGWWLTGVLPNLGEDMMSGMLIEAFNDCVVRVNGYSGNSSPDLIHRTEVDFATGRVQLLTGSTMYYQWLGPRRIWICSYDVAPTNADVYRLAVYIRTAGGRCALHCLNMCRNVDFDFQPIPTQSTKDSDVNITYKSDYAADWSDQGLDDAGTILCFADAYNTPGSSVKPHALHLTAGNIGHPTNSTGNSDLWRYQGSTGSNSFTITPAAGTFLRLQSAQDWSQIYNAYHAFGNYPGTVTATATKAINSEFYDSSGTGIYFGANEVRKRTCIRSWAIWNKDLRTEIETDWFDKRFGPSRYIGAPPFPLA